MDDFVSSKLTEWGLSDLIETFRDEGIDSESLYCLDEQDIVHLIPKVGPRTKFKKRLKLLQCQQEHEEAPAAANLAQPQCLPSTSDACAIGKRSLDLQGEPCQWQLQAKRRYEASSCKEHFILSDVKNIMRNIHIKLPKQNNKLNKFLSNKISDLETDKREMVGVFGKTGAGKSSLINAVIGETGLLPSGRIIACTSVMIKVEANMQSSKYEADIEFITKEEWNDELWYSLNSLQDNEAQANSEDDDNDDHDTVEKLSAVYGEEWRDASRTTLMDYRYFKEIPEFFHSKRKILTCETAEGLSAKCVKYTKSDSKERDGKAAKRCYWPLVKCVTVRVPNNDLLQHVTLVDLPGNGDRNKSRDEMWKKVVGSCSAVWVVTEITRAASEKEPWEILKTACDIMGNGGECQYIHFICTKSDQVGEREYRSPAGVRELIFKNNMDAKEEVSKEFSKLNKVKKHFSEDCFKVFTVSSTEFQRKTFLEPSETEIPKLQEFLQNLNDSHSQTLNYVTGAYGILSLIEGARCRAVAGQKADLCRDLEEKIRHELDKVKKPMEEAYEAFEKCLTDGVEKSQKSCERDLMHTLTPKGTKGRGFHRILKCVVENSGTYKPKKKKEINLNAKLASRLTDSIDEEFKKTFPNERKRGPFNGVISTFSLDTEKLIPKYKDVELQLIFLKTEEEKIKVRLNKVIRERKKIIYNSLTATIKENMQECYEKAKEFRGQGSLRNMQDTVREHVHEYKSTMFQLAKDRMLEMLRDLKEDILKTLKSTMQESIEISLRTDSDSIPDFSAELSLVEKYCNELKENQEEEVIVISCTP